jgi:hypothetical protein
MSAADWVYLKEEIRTELLLGRENGEAELETLGGQAKAAIRGHLKTGHREKP